MLMQYWAYEDTFDRKRRSACFSPGNRRDNIDPKLRLLAELGLFRPGARLLDVGCGTGAFLQAARNAGYDVEGIEPGWCSSVFARSRLRLPVVTRSVDRFQPNELFDIVAALHVLEHMPDPLAALRHFARICRPGGTIVIATPNLGSDRARQLEAAWEAVGPADHLFLFDAVTIRALADKAGLALIDVRENGSNREELVVMIRR